MQRQTASLTVGIISMQSKDKIMNAFIQEKKKYDSDIEQARMVNI